VPGILDDARAWLAQRAGAGDQRGTRHARATAFDPIERGSGGRAVVFV
jgi:hypothetical protein